MKTTIKEYPAICNNCMGRCQVGDVPNTTNPYRTCPVCNGTGIITIKETTFEGDSEIEVKTFPNYQ